MKTGTVILVLALIIVALVFTDHLKFGGNFQFQGVVGVDCPKFKTNFPDVDVGNSNSWFAADCDGNGQYEAYGYAGMGAISSRVVDGTFHIIPMDVYLAYHCYPTTPKQLWIYQGLTNNYYKYLENYGSTIYADTSCGGSVPSGQFICDSNSDGKISRTELGNTISKWVTG